MLGAYGGAGPLPEIRWTGGLGLNVLISMQPASIRDVVIQDLKFDSSYAGSTERNIVDVIMAAGENVTVRGCTFGHITQAVNSERGPVGVLVLENQVPVADSVRAYLCWVQGTDHTILGNVVNGSRFEHNVRLGGANRVLIAHNDLTNSPKTTIWAMEGENVYVRGNHLTSGQLALGPNHSDGSPDVRLQWAVAEGNTIDNALHAEDAALRIKAGTEHVMLRNNILLAPSQSAIQIAGYDPVMDRTNIDIRIYNNTAINGSLDGQFLNVGPGTEQLRVINNLYAAPNLISGVNHTSNVYVEDSGLSGFSEIASNLWSIPAAFAWVPEGYHYVWPYWSDPSGYRSPEEWDGFFQVHDEQYARICVDGTYAPSSESLNGGQAMPVAGVFTDFYGEPRSPGSWTVGAVEGGSEELQCPEPFGGGPFVDDFETDRGWVVENVDAINGIWQRDTPIGGESSGGPAADADGSGQCYLTGNQTGDSDVDGGATLLVSPLLDATWGPEATITFSLWCAGSPGGGSALPPPAPAPGGGGGPGTGDHGSEEEFTGYEPGDDEEGLAISLTSNAGAFWVEVEHLTQSTVGWETRTIRIADYVLPTDTVRVAFIATDLPPDGQLEVAIDDFRLSFAGAIGDVNADGVVTIDDLLIMIQSWGPCPGQGAACPADLNGDGVVGVSDLVLVMMNWQ